MIVASINKITQRFGVLTLVQLLTILFPLGIYLILINRVSIAIIGEITTWQMVFVIAAGISSYSFPQNLIPISNKLKNSKFTTACYWNKVLQIRYLFALIFGVLLFVFSSFLPLIALYSSVILVGRLYNPSSFFYVLSQNKRLLWFHFYTKLLALVLVHFCISKDNWYVTNMYIAISEIVIALPLLFIKKWSITFTFSVPSKIVSFFKKEKKLFFIQCTNTLLLSVTIPVTHLFFGAEIAGITAVAEKATSVIRGVSGNLFYAILPHFDKYNKAYLNVNLQKGMRRIAMFSAFLCLVSVGIVLFFKEMIAVKFQEIPMVYLLLMVQLVWFPVMMSTPFQIFCMKMERWNQLFLFSKIQLVVLVEGLFVLGHFFGIWGVISAIIIPEIVTFFLYKKEDSKQNL